MHSLLETFGDRDKTRRVEASRHRRSGGGAESEALGKRRLRSGWATTFIAGLELAKQWEVVLG